eukprot:UN10653
MFNSLSIVAANKVNADINFVQNYLLKYKPGGGTSFYQGFRAAISLINQAEETVIIFLTDGECSDGGSRYIVRNLKNSMKDKLSLYCITLAASTSIVVENICRAGQGKTIDELSGNELGTTFVQIAKKLANNSSFM